MPRAYVVMYFAFYDTYLHFLFFFFFGGFGKTQVVLWDLISLWMGLLQAKGWGGGWLLGVGFVWVEVPVDQVRSLATQW